MAIASNLGFPRIGPKRELKKAVESFWKEPSEAEMLNTAKQIRTANWALQQQAGIEHVPSNDFTLYDHVLDMIVAVGAIPERYQSVGEATSLDTYFAMARGCQKDGKDVTAMEMTKWFDTNYHYIVPEFTSDQSFSLSSKKIINEYQEAAAQGVEARPVLLGPVSFLLLGKMKEEGIRTLDLLPKLLPIYTELLQELEQAGASWVQIDEPYLAMDLDEEALKAFQTAYAVLKDASGMRILLATYFEGLRDNQAQALTLPVDALHIDLVRAPSGLEDILGSFPEDKMLSLGLIDGRNIWKTDLHKAIAQAELAKSALGSDRLLIGPSCSLLHSPVDLDLESTLDDELKNWLAFATQKLDEIAVITKAINEGKEAVSKELEENAAAVASRNSSPRIHNEKVKERMKSVDDSMLQRQNPYPVRSQVQRETLGLPLLPTTTIGSFPQTTEVRKARAEFKKGDITREQYDAFLEEETTKAIRFQEEIGIDVLVHGEFERNDMVEYFGEKLNGFAFTKFGWVQSYGSRCVKPPIIFGDVSRTEPMTVRWAEYAQKQTEHYMKGMLTGPVTILQWSFVRDDQPRSETCKQIGLAVRDEVVDLETAGIRIIQIDEAALREGLPLRKADWAAYLRWAVDAFRITASGVQDETQIHTHMCYSEFNDIINAVADMDADVISIETSRSQMELLDAFISFKYPNEIGPGVYDIHSPRVPNKEEMEVLLRKALEVLSPEQVWVNPDCGLKTRGWAEVKPALEGMIEATKDMRKKLEAGSIKASA